MICVTDYFKTLFPTVVYLSNLFLTCLTQIESSEINFKMVRHRIGWLTGELLSASRWVADKYSDETFVCFLTIELSRNSSAAIIVHSIRNKIPHKYRFFFIRYTYHLFNILCFNPVRIFNFYARMIFPFKHHIIFFFHIKKLRIHKIISY